MSSPLLCVCGDDRVTCHTGADDVLGDVGETLSRRGTSVGKLFMEVYYHFNFRFL